MRHVSYPAKTAAIVLAAGMSSRMGSPKQLARLGNATLLEHTLRWVRQTAVEEVILVLGFAADAVGRSLRLEGTKIVCNESYAEGMATSLKKGLSAIAPNTAAALVVLADQAFVRPETIDILVQTYHSSGPQIAIPTYRGFRSNPVLLDRSVFPEVQGLSGDV
jgi:molybdenum cofactor cytidylyltransferase